MRTRAREGDSTLVGLILEVTMRNPDRDACAIAWSLRATTG